MPITLDHEDLPPRQWECRICGSLNSDIDPICQWCEENLEADEDNRADRRIDERKHSK